MRVVGLLVFACGCRVAASSAVDATPTRGDGLPDRVITDGALWSDVRLAIVDAVRDAAGGADRSTNEAPPPANGDAGGDDGAATDIGSDQPCALVGPSSCVGVEACYPFPFEASAPTATKCAIEGLSGIPVQCQSQLECDGTTLCSAPGQSDSFCLRRCNLANPVCPTGFDCTAFQAYVGVGVCL